MKKFSRPKRDDNPVWTPGQFWNWFQSSEGRKALTEVFGSSKAQRAIAEAIKRVHPDLVWGLSPAAGGSGGTFEVSAGGLKELIPVVRSLVDAAPDMEGWTVVAFKQPSPDFSVQFGGGIPVSIDASAVLVSPTAVPGGTFDLEIFVPVPAATPRTTVGELAFIFLDHTLGEYTVMTRIGELSFDVTANAPPIAISLVAFAEEIQGC
jgi:hypothetical protein